MTRKKWAALSPKEQQIKVAELCGLTIQECAYRSGEYYVWSEQRNKLLAEQWEADPSGEYDDGMMELPDYLNDLNACHEFEETLGDKYEEYAARLQGLNTPPWGGIPLSIWDLFHATAAQRCEALVLTTEAR